MALSVAVVLIAIAGPSARAQSCELFVAALSAVGADSTNTILVDRTVMGVPTFAFNAYTTIRRGDTALAKSAEPQLRTLNAARISIPQCLADSVGWRTINDSTLFAIFKDGGRWPGFRERYPKTPHFALISQPIVSGDTATIYVAVASGDLDGHGVILRFIRDRAGHWVKQSEALIWVS